MKDIHVVAHTHWDFEWYFTRQEAQVQFAYHMDEVFRALENNNLNYYVLDGQISILDDYLSVFPEKKYLVKKYVSEKRLFIGPWYTQVDEMVTSGESMVRNLNLGMDYANNLGGSMKVGYLPDSFGQSQDIPKIYNGLGINKAIFWRGMPSDIDTKYFYWTSNDGSKVLTANIRNGYTAGIELIENDDFEELIKKTIKDTESSHLVLPVGGDQRPVDFNLKERVDLANKEDKDIRFVESNYLNFFSKLKEEDLPTLSGEFIDPSVSKIHRGIYSSRADLKQLYDQLERTMIYQVEPLSTIANEKGLSPKQGMIDDIWKTISLGQAHDSSGACNSDKTNLDIRQRGINALQQAESIRDYLLRKMSISTDSTLTNDLFLWNPLPFEINEVREYTLTTKSPNFELKDANNNRIKFEIIQQTKKNFAVIRRNPDEMNDDFYYITKIACRSEIPAMDWVQYNVLENSENNSVRPETEEIENKKFKIFKDETGLNLYDKNKKKYYKNFLSVEDGGDEGDNYDYSPAFHDWIINLNFSNALVNAKQGELVSELHLKGSWQLPFDLEARKEKKLNGEVLYDLVLKLYEDKNAIDISLNIDNQVKDHRLRLVINTDIKSEFSYADTPFGIIKRPVEDKHLYDWKEIGYKEEPTSMRPMIHFANMHSDSTSFSFLGKGAKDFQIIGEDFDQLAITIMRGVGYIGRPDMLRRPGDASGLQTTVVETPDSQLIGEFTFEGKLLIDDTFDPNDIQHNYTLMTQENLYYHDQLINPYTTPIQYFPINKTDELIKHFSVFKLENLKVTFSSLHNTRDQTGYELRLLNASNTPIHDPGIIDLKINSNIVKLNLKGELDESLANNVERYSLEPFKPGEVRTYGIFPNKH